MVWSHDDLDLTAGSGIAVREFPMKPGFGTADYVLYVDRMAIGAIEAKPGGTLTGVEEQSEKYAVGMVAQRAERLLVEREIGRDRSYPAKGMHVATDGFQYVFSVAELVEQAHRDGVQ